MPKKILIHSLIFSPDGVSTAYLYNDIALKFQENGYEVLVLTTNYASLQCCGITTGSTTSEMEGLGDL